MKRLTRAQIKAGMMPRTADSATDDKALGERPVIMSAMWRDGEDFLTRPHQEYLLVANMTEECSLIRQVAEGHGAGEVGTGRIRFILRHISLQQVALHLVHGTVSRRKRATTLSVRVSQSAPAKTNVSDSAPHSSGSNSFCRRLRARRSRVFTV